MITHKVIHRKFTYNIITMATFTIMAILLFFVVLGIGLLSDEEFTCLSDSYYTMRTCFFPAMALMAVCTLIPALTITPDNFTFLAFLMCGLIAFVGVSGDYKGDESKRKIHVISAYTSAVCSVTWVSLVCPWSLLWLAALPVAIFDKPMRILWLELMCFGMVFTTLLVQ